MPMFPWLLTTGLGGTLYVPICMYGTNAWCMRFCTQISNQFFHRSLVEKESFLYPWVLLSHTYNFGTLLVLILYATKHQMSDTFACGDGQMRKICHPPVVKWHAYHVAMFPNMFIIFEKCQHHTRLMQGCNNSSF